MLAAARFILPRSFRYQILRRRNFASASEGAGRTRNVEREKTIDLTEPQVRPDDPNAGKTFAELFRQSKFVELGDPNGKIVVGRIIRVVNDDLYIDFGLKFPCVCKRPPVDGELYAIGRLVRVRIHDVELSTRFLGSDVDLTLCEADATLMGLYQTREEIARQNLVEKREEFYGEESIAPDSVDKLDESNPEEIDLQNTVRELKEESKGEETNSQNTTGKPDKPSG